LFRRAPSTPTLVVGSNSLTDKVAS
jgi:hypothetical protein